MTDVFGDTRVYTTATYNSIIYRRTGTCLLTRVCTRAPPTRVYSMCIRGDGGVVFDRDRRGREDPEGVVVRYILEISFRFSNNLGLGGTQFGIYHIIIPCRERESR